MSISKRKRSLFSTGSDFITHSSTLSHSRSDSTESSTSSFTAPDSPPIRSLSIDSTPISSLSSSHVIPPSPPLSPTDKDFPPISHSSSIDPRAYSVNPVLSMILTMNPLSQAPYHPTFPHQSHPYLYSNSELLSYIHPSPSKSQISDRINIVGNPIYRWWFNFVEDNPSLFLYSPIDPANDKDEVCIP
jgi:hypothetical protein